MKRIIAFVLLCLIQDIFAMKNANKQDKSKLTKTRQEIFREREVIQDYNAIKGFPFINKPFIPKINSVKE